MLLLINITLEAHGAEQVKQAVQEITAETRTAATEARAHADALKADADAAKKRFQEAARAARDASEDQRDSARKVANALKDEADAARDAAKAANENAKALEQTNAQAVRETTRELKEQVRAAEQARAANEANARAIGASAQRMHQVAMMTPGGGAMAAVMGGGAGMRSQLGDLQAAQRNMAMAGDGGPMAVDVGLLDRAAVSAQNLTQNLGGVRNAALGITMVGAGGVMLSNKLGEISMQAENAKARMENLTTMQANHGVAGRQAGDVGKLETVVQDVAVRAHLANKDEARQQVTAMLSDEVKTADIPQLLESVVRNAQTLQKPMSEVGEAFSKAYEEGSLTRLKRCNILFSDQEEASVKAAYGISKAAGQTEFMRVVTAATERDVAKLGSALSDVQNKTNDNSRAFNDFAVATGEGSARADANLKSVAAGLARIVSSNPALAEGAGEILTYGSYAVTAIGGLVSFGAQLGQLYVAYMTLKTAKAADTIATTVNTGVTQANTVAQGELAIAEDAAAGSAGAEAIAVTGAGAASAGAGIAAAAAGGGFLIMAAGVWAALWPIIAIGAAVLAVVAAIYKLSGAWDAESQASKDAAASNKADREFFDKQKTRLSQGKSSQVKDGETFEQWQKRMGRGEEGGDDGDENKANASGPMPDFDKMKADAQAGQAAGAPAVPVTAPVVIPAAPTLAPTMPTASVPSESAPATSGAETARASAAAARVNQLESETNPHAEQIVALQRQKRDLKGKMNAGKRDDLQKQIDALQDAQRSWHTDHTANLRAAHAEKSAADKSAREAASEEKKHEREEAKEAGIAARGGLAVEKARINNEREDELDALGEALDKAKADGNAAAVRSLTLQIEQVKARQRYDEAMAAAAIETDATKRADDEAVARLNLEHDDKKATRTADHAGTEGGGKEREAENDAALRSLLHMSGQTARVQPLRVESASNLDFMPPMIDFNAPLRRLARDNGDSDGSGAAGRGEVQARGQMSQRANGEITVKFDELTVPYMGIAGLGGGV